LPFAARRAAGSSTLRGAKRPPAASALRGEAPARGERLRRHAGDHRAPAAQHPAHGGRRDLLGRELDPRAQLGRAQTGRQRRARHAASRQLAVQRF
jgi:hypothetical protein